MRVWIITGGFYFSETTGLTLVYKTKKGAIAACKQAGFKFNKAQGLYLNEGQRRYRRIDRYEVCDDPTPIAEPCQ